MKRLKQFTLIGLCPWLFNCQMATTQKGEYTGQLDHTSKTVLDWSGAYIGTTPCADCEEIRTLLMLNEDRTFRLETIYLGKSEEPFVQEGSFSFMADGNRVALKLSERVVYFHIGEEQVFLLDQRGEHINGHFSETYRLGRVGLQSGRWRLSRLKGSGVTNGHSLPFLEFTQDNMVLGFSGCNRILGEFSITGFNLINLGELALSRRMCPEDKFETPFVNSLKLIESYQILDDRLRLLYSNGHEHLELTFQLTP